YGPPYGSAEESFGRILAQDLRPYRDELVISSKAGWDMWPGPYGDLGSRKYLVASLDQSLKRMGLDYVDIFYHHRPDPGTPLEETMGALDHIVRSGRALYAGISAYPPELTRRAAQILRALGTPCLIHQPSYSMFNREVEQGLLTDKYLGGIPAGSRASKGKFLKPENITAEMLSRIRGLNELAGRRGQTLAQMAVAWVLRHPQVTSAIIGASRPAHIDDAVAALHNAEFNAEELHAIDAILEA